MNDLSQNKLNLENQKRRTFAIISHPDAGKTTLTEKLLFLSGAIQIAGTVRARKSTRYASSDWLEIEKQRGISVNSSVMTFDYNDYLVNLLDTPGHQDFSEDTYRVLTAVDSAVMVIDSAKGVETQTKKLMEVCRIRNTPIITFINKLDREGRDPFELLEEIEKILHIQCVPMTWPISMGKSFKGTYNIFSKSFSFYNQSEEVKNVPLGTDLLELPPELDEVKGHIGEFMDPLLEQVEMIMGLCGDFDKELFLQGKQTPVFFGSALHNFGIDHLLNTFCSVAPPPLERDGTKRQVEPIEDKFTGFIFKIQANMDLKHRDRIAFLRVCSGSFLPGMKVHHTRLDREIKIQRGTKFLAKKSASIEEAYAGDIIGIHDPGLFKIGDSLTEGEKSLHFTGLPNFTPEHFMRVVLKSPLKGKQLIKGLVQLSEEGATQVFKPFTGGDLILGAVGTLQFDVVKFRLQNEYSVEGKFVSLPYTQAKWIQSNDENALIKLESEYGQDIAYDTNNKKVFLAKGDWWFDYIKKNYPGINFRGTSED